MITTSMEEVNCPRCGKPMIMGSIKKEHKQYKDIVQSVKNGINYMCLNCMKGFNN